MLKVGKASSGAIFDYNKYRYSLWRFWDQDKPYIGWILLNPSIADELILDPTLKRCKKYSERWGYGGFYISNVFGLISTDPKNLYKSRNPVGVRNDYYLKEIFDVTEKVMVGWGNLILRFPERLEEIRELLSEEKVYTLKVTKRGQPSHPLYLKNDLEPLRYFI